MPPSLRAWSHGNVWLQSFRNCWICPEMMIKESHNPMIFHLIPNDLQWNLTAYYVYIYICIIWTCNPREQSMFQMPWHAQHFSKWLCLNVRGRPGCFRAKAMAVAARSVQMVLIHWFMMVVMVLVMVVMVVVLVVMVVMVELVVLVLVVVIWIRIKLALFVYRVISTSYGIQAWIWSEVVRLMCTQRKREARCSGIRPKRTSCRQFGPLQWCGAWVKGMEYRILRERFSFEEGAEQETGLSYWSWSPCWFQTSYIFMFGSSWLSAISWKNR